MRIITIMMLFGTLACSENLKSIEGMWAVDMAADERSSDTGPFFAALSFHVVGQSLQQELIPWSDAIGRSRIFLSYPLGGRCALAKLGQKTVNVSFHRKQNHLILQWQDPDRRENFVVNDFTLSNDGETLIVRVYLGSTAYNPDQTIILRRPHYRTK